MCDVSPFPDMRGTPEPPEVGWRDKDVLHVCRTGNPAHAHLLRVGVVAAWPVLITDVLPHRNSCTAAHP